MRERRYARRRHQGRSPYIKSTRPLPTWLRSSPSGFVADAEQRLWRTVMRRKYQITRNRVQLHSRLESLLEEAHIKLPSLVSDLGTSARRMLPASPMARPTLPPWRRSPTRASARQGEREWRLRFRDRPRHARDDRARDRGGAGARRVAGVPNMRGGAVMAKDTLNGMTTRRSRCGATGQPSPAGAAKIARRRCRTRGYRRSIRARRIWRRGWRASTETTCTDSQVPSVVTTTHQPSDLP